jgi:hypothetical protein
MRYARNLTLAMIAVAGLAAPAAQQAQTVDVTTLGPQAGQKAIEFRLPDTDGRQQTLASVAGPKGTMLVFFRSADW